MTTQRLVLACAVIAGCDRGGDPPAPAEAAAVEPTPTPASPVAAPVVAPVVPPAVEPQPHGFALLKPGATVHLRADDSVPSIVLPNTGLGFAVAVAGREGELVAFETLVDSAFHCAADVPEIYGLRLRWLAAAADLVPLTARRVTAEYSDGTRAELLAGVPLRKDGDGWIATAEGVEVWVKLPEGAVDRYYDPGDRTFPEATREPLGDGDEPLIYDRTRTLAEGRLDHTFAEKLRVATFAREDRDGRTFAEVRTDCAAIRVVVPRSRLTVEAAAYAGILGMTGEVGGGAGFVGLLGASSPPKPEWDVDAGVIVYLRDGALGGMVDRARTFDVAPEIVGTRPCFAVEIDGTQASRIDLCFDEAAVHETVGASPGELHRPAESGLIGLGSGSVAPLGGFGSGRLGSSAPRTGMGTATITGGLDKDIIRRIVRAHIGEVRHCYNQGLTKDPALAGKVTIAFTINGTGEVSTSNVKDDTVSDENVGKCIAKAVKRWKFPKPIGGGLVAVRYPFVLEPA